MTRRMLVTDAGLTFALLLITLGGAAPAGARWQHAHPVDAVAYALIAVAVLPLAVRRIWPLFTLAVTTIACSTYLILNYPYGPILFSMLVAVYTVAARLPLRRAAIACLLALGALLIHTVAGIGGPGVVGIVPGSAWVVVPFAMGVTVRVSRDSVSRSRAEQVRQRAFEERLRIAREVHDVVGHGLAAIHMQAEIALHVLPKRPEQASEALTAISHTSKQALDELRATLAVVRRSDGPNDRAPTPGLARLDDLVDRLAGTGMPVTVEVTGAPGNLPAAVDLAAYRVVQESLTNVLRHAGQAAATVRLIHRPEGLTVRVSDTGAAASNAGSGPDGENGTGGHGIVGMRERVTALGGTFEAGPAPTGGFEVQAHFPLVELTSL
jgi:signal transduction histidine kinase